MIERLKNSNPEVSGPAWQSAGSYGAIAVEELGALMSNENFEIARNAKRALQQIVRHAGRPQAKKDARSVQQALIRLLQSPSKVVRRETLWMLSEIGEKSAVSPMAALLMNPETREDARCALLRMPKKQAAAEFRTALRKAPEEFRSALAYSLRRLGETVESYPNETRVGATPTSVTEIPK